MASTLRHKPQEHCWETPQQAEDLDIQQVLNVLNGREADALYCSIALDQE